MRVKVCGVRTIDDALRCVDAGVESIGLNFWRGTPRCVDLGRAERIALRVGDAVRLVAVFVDPLPGEVERVRAETGIEWVQLHGRETPQQVARFLPRAYKALGVGNASVLSWVRTYPGEEILLDAKVPGAMPGGTGKTFDWALAREVAQERTLTLAGGLHPGNVAEAIRAVRPHRVDTASGVERAPGVKDAAAIAAFVRAANEA